MMCNSHQERDIHEWLYMPSNGLMWAVTRIWVMFLAIFYSVFYSVPTYTGRTVRFCIFAQRFLCRGCRSVQLLIHRLWGIFTGCEGRLCGIFRCVCPSVDLGDQTYGLLEFLNRRKPDESLRPNALQAAESSDGRICNTLQHLWSVLFLDEPNKNLSIRYLGPLYSSGLLPRKGYNTAFAPWTVEWTVKDIWCGILRGISFVFRVSKGLGFRVFVTVFRARFLNGLPNGFLKLSCKVANY